MKLHSHDPYKIAQKIKNLKFGLEDFWGTGFFAAIFQPIARRILSSLQCLYASLAVRVLIKAPRAVTQRYIRSE